MMRTDGSLLPAAGMPQKSRSQGSLRGRPLLGARTTRHTGARRGCGVPVWVGSGVPKGAPLKGLAKE